jgi:hypothetical protein
LKLGAGAGFCADKTIGAIADASAAAMKMR